ncbi:Putative zincin peptidase [Acetitomaculum ruminis DSM 5522]|uniref:Putative zincin peptidase n=1 Tax=Acetitomaculum ruminis DSM 5522 TaxID=1120918 RepID=A0A1I0V395_9FIRM|nr:DUF3267 domain-containing protein [Acetitomaculum ruminis]SFA70804.1 Putative zincin peptidase [Acetitomaculum ruminis DSM 5522]
MFNIHLKGKFRSEEDLKEGRELPYNAIMYDEGDNIWEVFFTGFICGIPVFALMLAIIVFRFKTLNFFLHFNIETMIVFTVTLIINYLLQYVHEIIHAFFYPKESEKEIWKYPEQGAWFIYCDALMNRNRFIAMCLAPAIILGIIPFIIWIFIANYLPSLYNICFVFSCVLLVLGAIGDFGNVYNTLTQVPKKAKVMNYGLHSFWILD